MPARAGREPLRTLEGSRLQAGEAVTQLVGERVLLAEPLLLEHGEPVLAQAHLRQRAELVRQLLRGVATVVPNLQLYVPTRYALLPAGDDGSRVLGYLANATSYAVLYATVLLVLAARIFRRRDLV